MAWIVFDAFEGRDAVGRLPAIYGPLPCKRWQRDGKRYKLSAGRLTSTASKARDKDEDRRLAVQYAIWLAARDGVQLSGAGVALFAAVKVGTVTQSRPYAVRFNNATINLPNWDWVPRGVMIDNGAWFPTVAEAFAAEASPHSGLRAA